MSAVRAEIEGVRSCGASCQFLDTDLVAMEFSLGYKSDEPTPSYLLIETALVSSGGVSRVLSCSSLGKTNERTGRLFPIRWIGWSAGAAASAIGVFTLWPCLMCSDNTETSRPRRALSEESLLPLGGVSRKS
jgi:hypothetical protein